MDIYQCLEKNISEMFIVFRHSFCCWCERCKSSICQPQNRNGKQIVRFGSLNESILCKCIYRSEQIVGPSCEDNGGYRIARIAFTQLMKFGNCICFTCLELWLNQTKMYCVLNIRYRQQYITCNSFLRSGNL